MKSLNIGVIGASGKIGKELISIIEERQHIPFFGIYAKNNPSGYLNKALDILSESNYSLAEKVDIWIDFSLPESFEKFIPQVASFHKPIISGTTGLTPAQKEILKEAAGKCPILWSSNMSIGIAVLTEALNVFKRIKHFDFQIEELHHRRKKDAPSGTAVTLQKKLVDVIEKEAPQPVSIRGGGIFGIHKVWAMSDQEVITFEHQALNRRVFAEGALFAGLKLFGKPNGLYELKDLL